MKLIIVGGGIAGLAAGIYARQSGIDATIFEMHVIPGGNCTSWKRKGYLFEGGMHWLVGSAENAGMHRVWKELGALQDNNPIYNRDPFLTYKDGDEEICLYRDPERLRKHLKMVSPGDSDAIDVLVKDIKSTSAVSMPVMDVKGTKLKYKSPLPLRMLFGMIKALPAMNRLDKITVREYVNRFNHPGIQELLSSIVGVDDYTASSAIFTLSSLSTGDSGYPEGGSLRLAQNMVDTFDSLGGVLNYKKRVEEVVTKEGIATGVVVDGEFVEADAVIVTADALVATRSLFTEPLSDTWIDELRSETTPLNCTFVCLGVNADLGDLPENVMLPLSEPFEHGGTKHRTIGFNNYANFAGYAPEGCTALTLVFSEDTYDEWRAAKEDGSYAAKKEAFAQRVIQALEQVVPQIKDKVEVWDVATPLTYERYCGTYRGSWMSVMKPGYKQQQYPLKSESIDNLYFAGQRLMLPGGLPVASMTGRQAVQHLCKDKDILFQSEYER